MKDIIINTNQASFSWDYVKKEARNYKYVVMYRDHYTCNGKGEFIASSDFDRVFVEQPYWFTNEDRPVYQVIFTNDEVPAIIADRQKILDQMNKVRYTMSTIQRPILQADGRSTRRTQPEAWAAFDKAVEDYNAQRDALQQCLNLLLETLGKLEYYSTTLLQLR